jgi:F-type H+-transporting ATPase subunit gamma
MTSERGLCGGFNTQIVRAAREKIDELVRAGKTVKILALAKRAAISCAARTAIRS